MILGRELRRQWASSRAERWLEHWSMSRWGGSDVFAILERNFFFILTSRTDGNRDGNNNLRYFAHCQKIHWFSEFVRLHQRYCLQVPYITRLSWEEYPETSSIVALFPLMMLACSRRNLNSISLNFGATNMLSLCPRFVWHLLVCASVG